MIYTIKLDGETFYDPRVKEYALVTPKLKLEVNKAGSFEFTIYQSHPMFSRIQKLKSIVEIFQDGALIFKGRVLDDELGFDNDKKVICEGELAYFNDTILRPYEFTGSVKDYLQLIVTQHNNQVPPEKKFSLGKVTVEDPNDTIVRSDKTYPKTWDVVEDKLIKSLGGYLIVRYDEDGNRFLDYLADSDYKSNQTIELGKNLLDLAKKSSSTGLATAILPLGAETEDEEGHKTGTRLNIESVNDGKDFIQDDEAVAKYGFILVTSDWKDVTEPQNLLRKARQELAELVKLSLTLSLTAVDLKNAGQDVSNFHLFEYVQVTSKPHEVDELLLVEKLELNLTNPAQDKLTIGLTRKTLTDSQVSTDKLIKKVESDYVTNDRVVDVQHQVTVQSSLIKQEADKIRTEVSETYTTKEEIGNIQTAANNAQEAAKTAKAEAEKASEAVAQSTEALEQAQAKAEEATQQAATAKEEAAKAQETAQKATDAAEEASGIAGSKGRTIFTKEDSAKVENQNDYTLFIDAENGNMPKKWDSEAKAWVAVQDQKAIEAAAAATEAQTAAGAATNTAKTAQETAQTAVNNAKTAQTAADTATGNAKKAQETADTAVGNAKKAQETADAAKAGLDEANIALATAKEELAKAQGTADAAKQAAQTAQDEAEEAAGIASGKGRTIFTVAESEKAENQNAYTLFIDTANGNAPKKWDDTAEAWVAVQDKKALDAASAATKAQNTADSASEAVKTAQSTAQTAVNNAKAAQEMADKAIADIGTANKKISEIEQTAEQIKQTVADSATKTELKQTSDKFELSIKNVKEYTDSKLVEYGIHTAWKMPDGTFIKTYPTIDPDGDAVSQYPQFVGFSIKDSDNPDDYEWELNTDYLNAVYEQSLLGKVDINAFADSLEGKADADELGSVTDSLNSLQNSYNEFVTGKYESDLNSLESRSEGLIANLADKVATFNFLQDYIKMGADGLIIGSKASPLQMLLTKDTLAFVDSGKVVAYFSNQSFYINRGAIVESLTVGAHKTAKLDNDYTVVQWVGGAA